MSSISLLAAGKTVRDVRKNGSVLLIRFDDGTSLTIGWRHSETGQAIEGEPVLLNAGTHIIARSRELPHRREVGL